MKHQAETAEREGDYGKVAEIRYSQIPAAEANIKSAQESLHAISDQALIKEEVDEDDIAEVAHIRVLELRPENSRCVQKLHAVFERQPLLALGHARTVARLGAFVSRQPVVL